MQKLCKYCNNSFISSRVTKISCSKKECKEKYHHEKSYIISKCEICGNNFEYRKSKPKRFCSKGCAQKSPDVIEKMVKSQRKTSMEKYGVEHPMKTDGVKKNLEKSMMEKYGVKHALENEQIFNKQKNTLMKKFGTDNTFEVPEMIEKSKQTKLEKYGDENYRNDGQRKETMLRTYGVEHYSKTKDFKNKLYKNTYDKLLSSDKFKNIKPAFSFDSFYGVESRKYEFICVECDTTFSASIDDGHIPKCPDCLKYSTVSHGHKEIYDYIKSILPDVEVLINNRSILSDNKELDIYIPSLRLAFEYDGLYWHSEFNGKKDKNYHLSKTNGCQLLGIKLIHIFENEWEHKKDIIKSVINNVLNINRDKIWARKCKLKLVNTVEKNEFLIQNHLQGSDNSSVRIGLYYNNELVSIMTFAKSRFDKHAEWEILRFCNKINFSVVGAASKLVKNFIKQKNAKSIVTYSDRRYFDGSVYVSSGFKFISETKPNYWYILRNLKLSNRMNYQKSLLNKKLDKFDPILSEWENMKLNGYDRIWDCGNLKFMLEL